jgi:hypothetical protein
MFLTGSFKEETMNSRTQLEKLEEAYTEATRHYTPAQQAALEKEPRDSEGDGDQSRYAKGLYREITRLKTGVIYYENDIAHPV